MVDDLQVGDSNARMATVAREALVGVAGGSEAALGAVASALLRPMPSLVCSPS